MRGKVPVTFLSVTLVGITPAYAGKSIATLARKSLIGDHPRLCGEKSAPYTASSCVYGSPPPMRGKGYSCFFVYKSEGITPAYAGKSSSYSETVSHTLDHPRLCGEK